MEYNGRRIASESKQTVRGGPKPAKVGLHRRLRSRLPGNEVVPNTASNAKDHGNAPRRFVRDQRCHS